MKYDFDTVVDRGGNRSAKYDERMKKFGTDQVIPLWIADMDFKTAQPIVDALTARAQEGIWGYTSRPDSYFEAIRGWQKRRNGWDIDPSLMSFSLGVVQSISAMVKLFTPEGGSVLIQTPVYSEFYDMTEAWNRKVLENPFVEKDGRWEMDWADFEAKLAEAEAQLQAAEAQLQAGEEELAANAPRLEAARRQLEDGQAQYEAGLRQYNDGLAQLDAAEKQLAEAKTQLDANAAAYEDGIRTMADAMGVDAEQLDAFIGWLAQNCDANGTQPPQNAEELWQALQEYGDLTIIPADMTQEQVDAIRTQAADLLTVIDAIPTDTLPEEQKQRLQEARAHIAAIADAADPAAMRTALQTGCSSLPRSCPMRSATG